MADEKPSGSDSTSSSGSGRKSKRRRPSRNRKRPRKARGDSTNTPQSGNQGETADERSQRARRDRRRRRRSRKREGTPSVSPSQTLTDDDLGIVPTGPVSVYTHVIRPSLRDSYEFRSEHFSKVSRRLEDFRIDLSPLFPEEVEADQQEDASFEEEVDDQTAGSTG